MGAAPYFTSTVGLPSAPDNWLGGTGNWSNPGSWSSGLPGQSSDVTINTGNDSVTLDVSDNINSLVLGGSSGSSTLVVPEYAGYTLNIAGTLTVNRSGSVAVGIFDSLGAGNTINAGGIEVQGGTAQLGNLINTGGIGLDASGELPASLSVGTLNNSGSIAGLGFPYPSLGATSIVNSGEISGVAITANTIMNSGIIQDSTLSLNGTLTNTAIGQIAIGIVGGRVGGLINNGQLAVPFYDFQVLGDASNTGQINVFNEAEDPNGTGFSAEGTLTNTSTGQIAVAGLGNYFSSLDFGNLMNSGTVQLQGSSVLYVTGNVTNSGTISSEAPGNNEIFTLGRFVNNPGAMLQLLGAGDTANIANLINSGTVSVGNGATLTVPVQAHAVGNALAGFLNSGTVLIASGGAISSPSRYTQTAGQTVVDGHLSGVIAFAGGSVFGNGGTISGSINSNASINMGDALMTVGQMTFAGNYTQGLNGSLTFDIAGQNQYDQLSVTGSAHLNGLMTVDLLHGYIPQIGNQFEIMTFGSETGTFSTIMGLPINGQEHFVLEYNLTNLTLNVVSGQLAGASSIIAGSENQQEPFITGTPDSSGSSQLALYRGSSVTTPEPGSLLLISSGILPMLLRRRRHN